MNNALVTQSAPYSQEAEESVLGSVQANPAAFLAVVQFMQAEMFFFFRHGYIWQAMLRLHERNQPIDYLLLMQELKDMGWLEEIGGPAYLTYLVNVTPDSTLAELYGRLVERAWIRRRLMITADEIKALALNEELTIETVTTDAETKLYSVTHYSQVQHTFTAREVMHSFFDRMEAGREGQVFGIPSGYRDLDDLLGGFQKGTVNIIGGRPGMGKSALLLCLLLNMTRLGVRVALFSMEMPRDQVGMRLTAIESGISTTRLMQPEKMSAAEYHRAVEATSRLDDLSYTFDDSVNLQPATLRAKIRSQMLHNGVDVVMLDYAQLMSGGTKYRNDSNRVAELSFISKALTEIAKELNVSIIAAAQLSRAVEQRQSKRPVLADLRETGSWEQDAYTVIFPYRDVLYNEATEFPNQADLIVAKNRNGPTGTISLYYDKSVTRFADAATRRVFLDDDALPKRDRTIPFSRASGGSHVSMSQPEEKD